MDTHLASHARGFIHNDGACQRIPVQCRRGADRQAQGGFALLAGDSGDGPLIQIDVHPDVGVFALEPAGIVKRTDLLTAAAAQTAVGQVALIDIVEQAYPVCAVSQLRQITRKLGRWR